MNKFLRSFILYVLLAVLAVSIASSFTPTQAPRTPVKYSEFITRVNAGEVKSVTFIGQQELEGKLRDGRVFTTTLPPQTDNLVTLLETKGVEISARPTPAPPWWMQILPNVITLVIFVGVWLFILNQMQGGGNRALSFGKSRARLHTEDKPKVTFEDVAGLDEAKVELQEIVEFLKHPRRFVEVGAKIPKGVLLVGPPGTGKTLLGRAIAGEAGVPFFSISGSDFVEMFVGVGAARVRDLFDTAKKNAPCIVFIDEIDAVGRQRGAGLGGGHDEREQTLNQLLVEMDGFETNSGIIILAATNRPDVLDPALLRPGRFDRQVVVDRPDVVGREEILRIYAKNKPLADDVDLKTLARRTPGFTGADLENLMNEAAILAARRSKRKITMEECNEAIDRVMMGPEHKRRVMSEKDKLVFAYHEAGHAIVAHFQPHMDPVHKVSIIGRGTAGGYTMWVPVEDKYVTTKTELLEYLSAALAGRAAEEIVFGEISTGAESDLDRVTKMARKMITEYGMSEDLGPISYGRPHEEQIFLGRDIAREKNYSEEVAAKIDREVRRIVEERYEAAKEILRQHRAELDRVVEALRERETLSGDEFRRVVAGEPLAPASSVTPAAGGSGAAAGKVAADTSRSEKQKKPRVIIEGNPA
ncbi:MAG TPA: ATP-dependent metallopeptidase FtsH/Yme1/Tma family protein [Firmicutes bacterium]|nr:ATP-dependent metallopeptidase FtsH/Yme1/Tma family protein [Bacillota bacterium]